MNSQEGQCPYLKKPFIFHVIVIGRFPRSLFLLFLTFWRARKLLLLAMRLNARGSVLLKRGVRVGKRTAVNFQRQHKWHLLPMDRRSVSVTHRRHQCSKRLDKIVLQVPCPALRVLLHSTRVLTSTMGDTPRHHNPFSAGPDDAPSVRLLQGVERMTTGQSTPYMLS